MPYDDYSEYEEDASIYNRELDSQNQIHPQDSYSDRFTVSSRQTFNSKPKPAIITGTNRVANKDKIFSKKHSGSNYGGNVDMASVAKAAAEISKKKQKLAASSAMPAAPHTTVQPQRPANNNKPAQEADVEKLRSSGLDSLFSSTSDNTKNSDVNKTPAAANSYEENQQEDASVPEITQPFAAVKANEPTNSEDVYKGNDGDSLNIDSASKTNQTTKQVTQNNDAKKPQINPAKAATEQFRKLRQERKLQIIKPLSYNTAKEISSALAAGDAVVLVLTHVYSDLAKRVLDFAFGAASMCGARVNVEGDQVYAFTIGQGLTQRERLLCVKQGIMLDTVDISDEQ